MMGEIASASQLRMSFLRWALFTVPLILLLGIGTGALAGAGAGNHWFDALAKPEIMPPGWIFGIAWTVLYILMGLALAIILHARRARGRRIAVALFVVQLAMNLAWQPIFFVMHDVQAALGLIVALAGVATIVAILFARIRIGAGLLMLPYVAWLVFAALLTFQIDQLNPDAEMLAPGETSTQIAL
jgi:tryptophan-rich sensory protein